MAPPVALRRLRNADAAPSICEPDLSYLHGFNDVGGRPDERRGKKGGFLPGVRIMGGGLARDVPLEADINPGNVLHTYPNLKPDMSGEARANVTGGRPDERLGSRGAFTPGIKAWCGGEPREAPLEVEINPGTVLHTYPNLKPNMSGEARTNEVGGRPGERLGFRGAFTPGPKIWCGGEPRDVPLEAEVNAGTVLHTYSNLKPDMSGEARTNVTGGRAGERLGSRGAFTPGAKAWGGGQPRDVPLEAGIGPGTVLRTYPNLKPDLSDVARTNVVGGRPDERLGSQGAFTAGIKAWRGGEPREILAEREISDHGIVLSRAMGGQRLEDQPEEESVDDDEEGFDIEEPIPLDVVGDNPLVTVSVANGSGFRRCGSDSKFPVMGTDVMPGAFTTSF